MDPISQATLGAIAARVAAPRMLAGPVLLSGAVAGAMPDIDIVFTAPGDFFSMVRVHRGITHSLFFAFTAGPLIGWLIARYRAHRDVGPPHTLSLTPASARSSTWGWMFAMTAAILSHPLLDVLTPYGTQLLQPFSDQRFAVHAMPIIDPFYTGVLLIGCIWAARSVRPRSIALGALLLSSAYLALGWQLGVQATALGRADLVAAGIQVDRIEAFPTLLQPWQRQVVARSGDQDRIGLLSMWAPCAPVWTVTTSASGPHVEALLRSDEGRTFDWFALGWVHYTLAGDAADMRLHASDLRYVLSGDATDSVFSLAVRMQINVDGEVSLAGIETAGQRGADPARLTQAMASVFTPACQSVQVAEGQGGGRLDAFHGEGG